MVTIRPFMRPVVGWFISTVVALVLGAPAAAQAPGSELGAGWPFKGSGLFGMDLFNLGLLGAKASDADAPPPQPKTYGMKRVQSSPGAHKEADIGPEKLRLEVLFPEGPAAKAGLNPGDVVVGVEGGGEFCKGSNKALSDALRRAEANSNRATVTLLVAPPAGAPASAKVRKVAVAIPGAASKDLVDPSKPAARAAWARVACDWLAKRQREDGGFPETLCGLGGAVVQTSVAGLAWLATGSTAAQGPHALNVAKARAFVAKNAGVKSALDAARPAGGPNHNQENWAWCHAALFLGELCLREPTEELKADLRRCSEAIVKNQEATGGWAHGPGGPNGLGYVELNIMAGLALGGLGLAKQCGVEPSADAVRKAVDYVEASSSGGGVGYSTNPGQKGQGNIGRSAGCWLGYRALGLEKRRACDAMRSYAARSIGEVLGGHASLMQQTFLAGVAAAALGAEPQRKFWAELADDVVLARAPDGSFQPRPWHESVAMGSNSDVSTGEVWTTACWATVLAADGPEKGMPGLSGWAALKKKP
jgi:hypothetical protein